MTAFVDTNILIRHLTGDPPAKAKRATANVAAEERLLVAGLIVAEAMYVLESFYEAPRPQVAETMRSLLALDSVYVDDPGSAAPSDRGLRDRPPRLRRGLPRRRR